MALPDGRGKSGIRVQRRTGFVDGQRHHVELNIRAPAFGVFGAGTAPNLARADGQRPGGIEQPLQAPLNKFEGISNAVV